MILSSEQRLGLGQLEIIQGVANKFLHIFCRGGVCVSIKLPDSPPIIVFLPQTHPDFAKIARQPWSRILGWMVRNDSEMQQKRWIKTPPQHTSQAKKLKFSMWHRSSWRAPRSWKTMAWRRRTLWNSWMKSSKSTMVMGTLEGFGIPYGYAFLYWKYPPPRMQSSPPWLFHFE